VGEAFRVFAARTGEPEDGMKHKRSRHARDDDRLDPEDRPRSRKSKKSKRGDRALVWGLVGGGIAVLVVGVGVVLFLVFGGGPGKGGLGANTDPVFEQIKKGMAEEDVVQVLGEPAWSYQPRAVGIWTYPRMSMQEVVENQERNRDIRDVIFVYFRDGKVDNIYRKTGEEFRQPPR
jgi:hypothetical protein